MPLVLTSASPLWFAIAARWLEKEDRVSYWQRLHGAWQGEPQPVQLRGLEIKVTKRHADGPIRLKRSSHYLWLQWTLTIIIFNPETDKWMDTAPQDFCQGSCDPVDCMPILKRILSTFLSASERAGLPQTEERRRRCFSVIPFFKWRRKYLFTN